MAQIHFSKKKIVCKFKVKLGLHTKDTKIKINLGIKELK